MSKTLKYDSLLGAIREDDALSVNPLLNLHTNGEPEYAGNTSFTAANNASTRGLCNYFVAVNYMYIRYIEGRFWTANNQATCQVRVYKGYKGLSSTITPSALTLLKTANYVAGIISTATSGVIGIELDSEILLAPGEGIYMFLQPTSTYTMSIPQWDSIGSPQRQPICFSLNTTDVWANPWNFGSVGYYGVPLKLYSSYYLNNLKFNPRLIIPANIYVAQDRECNLWKDAVSLPGESVDFICSKGKAYERSFRYTGLNADIGTTTSLSVIVKDKNNTSIQSRTVNLKPVAKNAGTGTKQILVIGDSLVNGSESVTELRTLISTDGGITPLMLGTKGTNPNRHEGVSGSTFSTFITASSPFWISGRNDFKAYLTANSNFGGTNIIDYAIIQLGTNDVFSGTKAQADIDAIIANAKTLINNILDSTYGFPACKIILAMPPICGNTSNGFADSYGAVTQRQQFENNMRLLWENMITSFDNGVYHAQVTLCASGLWIDRTYGYALSDVAVSSRVATTEKRHTNAVHPTTSGYQQIADAWYSTLRFLLT